MTTETIVDMLQKGMPLLFSMSVVDRGTSALGANGSTFVTVRDLPISQLISEGKTKWVSAMSPTVNHVGLVVGGDTDDGGSSFVLFVNHTPASYRNTWLTLTPAAANTVEGAQLVQLYEAFETLNAWSDRAKKIKED